MAELKIINMDEVPVEEVKWLWYPYIPFGKVTLLQGDPGDGKSKLMLSLFLLPLCFPREHRFPLPMRTRAASR